MSTSIDLCWRVRNLCECGAVLVQADAGAKADIAQHSDVLHCQRISLTEMSAIPAYR